MKIAKLREKSRRKNAKVKIWRLTSNYDLHKNTCNEIEETKGSINENFLNTNINSKENDYTEVDNECTKESFRILIEQNELAKMLMLIPFEDYLTYFMNKFILKSSTDVIELNM